MKMKLLYIISLILYLSVSEAELRNHSLSLYVEKYNLLEQLTSKISRDLKFSYRIMIFLSNARNNKFDYNNFIAKVSQDMFTVITETAMISTIPEEMLNRDTTIYIILSNIDDGDSKVKSFIKTLEFESWFKPRPKCLLIYFHNGTSENMLRNIFKSIAATAWTHKFLDFTTISVSTKEVCSTSVIYYNNYFQKSHAHEPLHNESVIFPDKFLYANGFTLNILAVLEVTYVDKFGYLHSESPIDNTVVPLVSMALKKANFSIKLKRFINGIEITETKKYYNSKMNIILRPALINRRKVVWQLLRVTDDCQKVVAIVPLLPDYPSIKFEHIIAYVGVMVMIIIAVACARKFFSSNDTYWSTTNIAEILMGMTAETQPRTIIQNIFFICFILISMKYSADFYSDVVDIQFVDKTVSFDTYKDMVKSNLSIYGNSAVMALVDTNDDPHVEIIKKKVNRSSKYSTSIFACLDALTNKRARHICLTIDVIAHNKTLHHAKIAKPVFHCVTWAYQMESASPYSERLQIIINMLKETGFAHYFKSRKNSIRSSMREDNPQFHEDKKEVLNVISILLGVLIVGCSLSILSFICELIYVRIPICYVFLSNILNIRKRNAAEKKPKICIIIQKLKFHDKSIA